MDLTADGISVWIVVAVVAQSGLISVVWETSNDTESVIEVPITTP